MAVFVKIVVFYKYNRLNRTRFKVHEDKKARKTNKTVLMSRVPTGISRASIEEAYQAYPYRRTELIPKE
jgi:hypothetical protein